MTRVPVTKTGEEAHVMNIPRQLVSAAQEAKRHLEAGDPKGAVRIGEPVLRSAPNHTGMHVILARA